MHGLSALGLYMYISVSMCVCVRERERERGSEYVCTDWRYEAESRSRERAVSGRESRDSFSKIFHRIWFLGERLELFSLKNKEKESRDPFFGKILYRNFRLSNTTKSGKLVKKIFSIEKNAYQTQPKSQPGCSFVCRLIGATRGSRK